MNKTWRPATAGILDIIGGALNLLGFIAILVVMFFVPVATSTMEIDPMIRSFIPYGMLQIILWTVAIATLIFAIVPIIGGIYAIKRTKWGMALAGSIVLFFGSTLLGIASIVLTALSHEEFE
ncbi:hypothetical protein ACFLXC_02075 [Chloroflexota bacterium]